MAVLSQLPRALVVLDTNVLIHLAEEHAGAHNTVLRCVKFGWIPVITQTVILELGHTAQYSDKPKKRYAATIALSNLLAWGIQPTGLKPVGNGICGIVAEQIVQRRLLPPDEKHDAYVLIEAAFHSAKKLISWDRHFLDADQAALNKLLNDYDLPAVEICSPERILAMK
jgi:predicted nucleic acid-binding protein